MREREIERQRHSVREKQAETGRDISKQRDAGRNRELKTNIFQNGIRMVVFLQYNYNFPHYIVSYCIHALFIL